MGVKIKNFFNKYKFILAGLFLFFGMLIIVLFPSFSEKTSTSLWDGSVATKFSQGSGLVDDPYVINDGSELAYFFILINGDNYSEYYNKYYELNNNIDLNNIPFNYTKGGKSFNGYLDGNGYTIKNLLIDTPFIDEDGNQNYSLFDELNGSTIKNINFVNSSISIKNNEYTEEIKEEKTDSNKETETVEEKDNIEAEVKIVDKQENIVENETSLIDEQTEIVEENSETSEEIENKEEQNSTETESKKENTQEEKTKTITLYKNVEASLLSNNVILSNISNINVNNINIESEKENEKIKSSFFILNDNDNNKIFNVNINGNSSLDTTSILIDNYSNADISLVLYSNENLKLINNSDEKIETAYKYTIKNNKINFDDNYPIKSILELLNNNSELTWAYDNSEFRIVNNGSDPKRPIMKMMSFRSTPEAHDSGLDSSTHTVYVNDYESDKNYYGGLNYTYSSNATTPTLDDKNIYSDSNLVYVQLNYHGTDINNVDTGYVSLTEQYSDFVYYKVYEVSNGYVTIDLIDNPYGDRPNNKAFSGWVTDYPGAEITLDTDVYVRRVRIPVTMNGSTPNNINIDLYALWQGANTIMAGTTSWDDLIADETLKNNGFYSIMEPYEAYTEDMTAYYLRQSIRRNNPYPSGAVNSSGNALTGNCGSSTCNYYVHCTVSEYNPNTTYYRLRNGSMNTYTPTPTQLYRPPMPLGTTASGLYKQVNIPRNASMSGYYDSNGQLQSGNCNTSGGCTCYELIQYYDADDEIELVEDGVTYYNLTTRDTNIIVVNASRTNNNPDVWTSQTKPFTVTSINNNTNYVTSNNATWRIRTSTLTCTQDTRIEYVRVYANATKQNNGTGPTNQGALVGNYNNVKIGRGLVLYGNNTSFSNAGGGKVYNRNDTSATGSASNLTKYTFIVESGAYNNLSVTAPTTSSDTSNIYIKGYATYGSDFDRVNNDNSKLEVRYCACGSWTGNIRGASGADIAMYTTIKSGQFGSNKYDYAAGVYVGGRNAGANYSARAGTIEGGYIYNLIGGPLSQSSNKSLNDTYMYIKGGSVDIIVGGAGQTTTYGNRIIQVTDGQINYAIFGGSNGVNGSGSDGTLDGDTYVYVGGNAIIGDENLVNNNTTETNAKVEAGSVFGIGNGKSGSTSIGTVNNSYVVIDGNATIRRNVYGGGNYGAAGQSGTNKTYETKINIHNGATINGSVYGGGNNNGSGSTSNTDNITINMDGGTVNGSIYGGSRTLGRVYGSTTVNVTGGTIKTDIYGGGEGGYTNDTNYGTFVRDDVSITIGNNEGGPTINGNVYGGSAYGTVNAVATNAASNNKSVDVVVNNGNIIGSVFGGAKGSNTFTPYVKGTIDVTINGGTVTNVYGGFDMAGSPEHVNINSNPSSPSTPSGTENKYWVKINDTSEITTSDIYMIVNSTDNYSLTFENTSITRAAINVSSKGTTSDNRAYYDITGDGSTENCQWQFETAVTGGKIKNYGDNTKYFNLTNYSSTTNVLTTSDNATSNTVIEKQTNNLWHIYRRSENQNRYYYISYLNNAFSISNNNDSNADLIIYKQITVEQTPTVESYWVKINGTSDITTNDVYMFTNEANNAVLTYSDSVFAKENATVTEKGTTDDNRTYYEISGTNLNINCEWKVGTNGTVGRVFNNGDNTKYMRLSTYYDTYIVASGNASTNITFTSAGNNLWYLTRTSGNSGSYYVNYTNNNFGLANNNNNARLNIYKKIEIEIEPEEPDTPDEPDTPTDPTKPAMPSVPENVSGNVHVYLNGGTITNAFGGGNNTSIDVTDINLQGSTVTNIYGGSNNSGDVIITDVNVTSGSVEKVFGGNNVGGTCVKANVDIDGGIISGAVYGGGNEVFTTATYVNINSTENTIPAVYGGGNNVGDTDTSPGVTATNVVIDDGSTITNLYGGSNDNGVVDIVNIEIKNGTISNVYGGGNNADANYIDLNIIDGSITGAVYGGGNNANVNTVDIDISDGTINTLYGGGNNGNVLNQIDIDMTDGTITNDMYGGGNNGSVSNTINLTTTGGSVGGSVYGGGKGTTATVGDNIFVTMSETPVSGNIFGGGNAGAALAGTKVDLTSNDVTGTVYGGGNAADVDGNIIVNISSSDINGYVFGGGNEGASHANVHVTIDTSSEIHQTVYGGGNAADVDGAINVDISSSDIDGDVIGGGNEGASHSTVDVTINNSSSVAGTVYGGGNAADVDEAITVTISSSTVQNDVFGGGNEGESHSSVTVTIDDSSEISGTVYGGGNAADVVGAIEVNVTSSEIGEDVFGGGNNGESDSTIDVIISSSAVSGTVYGGGNAADVIGAITVNISSSDIQNDVFGGGNEGASHSTVDITINNSSSVAGTVYGGGNAADVTGAINVNIASSIISEDIYGGGNNGKALNSTSINTSGNTSVTGDIYGGGNNGSVAQNSSITMDGGTIGGSAYGGGKGATATVSGNATVNITSGTINNDVFGGGNNGYIGGNTEINTTGGNILGDLYGGGNNATVNGNTSSKLKNTTIAGNAYGGGNNGIVSGDSSIVIENVTVNGSIYGGGNLATVEGDTNLSIGGTSVIGTSTCSKATECSVFGGGNKAEVGTSNNNNSIATVNIAGATVYGNVYGGCNTSRVYGQTTVNIGDDVITDDSLTKGTVLINGTVFGGGEANASGSEEYDYSYISVTNAIVININGNDYTNFDILGSIFGSGNASTSGGTSEITIKNYGTYSEPKRNISIQRTGLLIIDNSSIALVGAKDRTNRFSDYLFSLSIIDELQLKNNSTLYLETGANLLKSFKSLTATGEKETVTIDDDNKTVTKNVDNRVYMLAGSQTNPLNIATNQDATTYGEVYGMTFFGMYVYGVNNSVNVGMYGKYDYDEQYQGGIINGGAYVLGGHKTNHDIQVDGFYSNIVDELTSLNTVYYIEPTPADSNFYRWIIGEDIKEINVDLKASKYSTLSTKEVMFTDYTDPNTTFEIIGFDYSELAEGISLVDRNDVPRIAASDEEADSIMSLSMEAADTGWLTTGSTYFLTNSTNPIFGTTTYVGENTSAAPSMILFIHHSKNLATSGDMGKVSVVLRITTKIDELTSEFERLVVNINLTRDFITTDDYEAAITGGRKYSLFASTATNITSKSSFSAYYSLFKEGTNVYKTGDHRALVSSIAFPENTKITMIDISGNKYYYHVITAAEEQSASAELIAKGDIHYNLSIFEEMGAQNSGVYYDDAQKNIDYYNVASQAADEEFIFIVDFEDTNISQTKLENSILLEMLDVNDETKISVIGEQHPKMVYNLYTGLDAELAIDGTIDHDTIYSGESFLIDVTSEYTQSVSAGGTVVDTQFLDSKLGMKISLYNSNNELVSGASLLGLTYIIDGISYSPNLDGTTRIRLADKVGNIEKWIRVNTGTSNLATGNYKLVIENFASPDGIYYGLNTADSVEFDIRIINEIYGLNVETEDEMVVIYGNEGYNLNGNERLIYNIIYNSGLENPEIHLKMYRRKYDEVYDTNFELVNLQEYVSNPLATTSKTNEFLVVNNPSSTNTLALFMKQHLLNGTYKMEFILYDGNSPIGSVEKYIIIK